MSYLSVLRMHFSGRFQAAVSTVNNDPAHYNNLTFKPEYQMLQDGQNYNGWWNPNGDADWRFIGCKITNALMPDGSRASADPVLSYLIADNNTRAPAKLVDLDSYQQIVSQIWGLEVQIRDADGNIVVRGEYQPVGFIDIWTRCPSLSGDSSAGAVYQSVITDLHWGDISKSPFLQALKQAAALDNMLSIKFTTDLYDAHFGSPTFTTGRIFGTIGVAHAHEPRHFVMGRQFMAAGAPGGFFTPAGQINFCTAVVDAARGKVLLDLGNALPVAGQAGNAPLDLGNLTLSYLMADSNGNPISKPIGALPLAMYTDPNWYPNTAGVIEFPADRPLTKDELSDIQKSQLQITSDANTPTGITEGPLGLYIRADQFVYRLNPGDTAEVTLYASQFGLPYANARVICIFDNYNFAPIPSLPAGTPLSALSLPTVVVTDEAGIAKLPLGALNPGNPRKFIDGQVYGIRPMLEETIPSAVQYPFNPWDIVSLLVWSAFTPEEPPTWEGSMKPIFTQYANLYPVMRNFLDLSSYEDVAKHVEMLTYAFSLDMSNSNTMPVTRDLSSSKREAILRWLRTPDENGLPLRGTPAPTLPEPHTEPMSAVPSGLGPEMLRGKAHAIRMMRRYALFGR